jgi:hypothetical protein
MKDTNPLNNLPHPALPLTADRLDQILEAAHSALSLLLEKRRPNRAQHRQIEDLLAPLVLAVDPPWELIDIDGSLRSWLTDVVRELRRGNPGAARFELDQVCKRLQSIRDGW